MAKAAKNRHYSPGASTLPIGYRNDTIVAVATPSGAGGIAVVRLSGPNALALAQEICDAPLGEKPRYAFLTQLREPADGQLIDQALATYFKGPHSFTGEDLVEFSTHGGQVTPQVLVKTLMALNARPAEPGEFSLRAFLNGKMDLAEAEAMNEMVSSITLRGQETAAANLTGRLSMEISNLRETLLQLLTILEHELDFSEEEIDPLSRQDIKQRIATAIDRLSRLINTAPYGRIIRDGVHLVIIGPPNVGKSSLFNALMGHEKAIVTPIPGTTRDSLEGWIDIEGFPVCLVDTAGLRNSQDPIEQIGVERTRAHLKRADILLVLDADDPVSVGDLVNLSDDKIIIYTKTKVDDPEEAPKKSNLVATSIKREDGLDDLIDRLKEHLRQYIPSFESAIVTSDRQYMGLRQAIKCLTGVQDQLHEGQPLDIISGEIRLSVNALAEIIGETTSEEVILRIFSEFCVGK